MQYKWFDCAAFIYYCSFARSCWSVFVPILVLIHYSIMWIYWTLSSLSSSFVLSDCLSYSHDMLLANPLIWIDFWMGCFLKIFHHFELASNKKSHRPFLIHRAFEQNDHEKEREMRRNMGKKMNIYLSRFISTLFLFCLLLFGWIFFIGHLIWLPQFHSCSCHVTVDVNEPRTFLHTPNVHRFATFYDIVKMTKARLFAPHWSEIYW